jgi:hypothetical protein
MRTDVQPRRDRCCPSPVKLGTHLRDQVTKANCISGFGSFVSRAIKIRKEIDVPKKIKKGRAYICGLGLFELYLNGKKVGNDVLVPALSEYHKRSHYLTYNVTSRLTTGENAIGIMLGNGRYLSPRNSKKHPKYDNVFPKLIFQLELEYSDGSKETVVSDESWEITANGPITANNEYDGEIYDARKEIPGWNEPGFDDTSKIINTVYQNAYWGIRGNYRSIPITA